MVGSLRSDRTSGAITLQPAARATAVNPMLSTPGLECCCQLAERKDVPIGISIGGLLQFIWSSQSYHSCMRRQLTRPEHNEWGVIARVSAVAHQPSGDTRRLFATRRPCRRQVGLRRRAKRLSVWIAPWMGALVARRRLKLAVHIPHQGHRLDRRPAGLHHGAGPGGCGQCPRPGLHGPAGQRRGRAAVDQPLQEMTPRPTETGRCSSGTAARSA